MKNEKVLRREKIKKRIRSRISGTAECPRFCVYKSNTTLYAQIVDDTCGHTLVACSSRDIDKNLKNTNMDIAKKVGELLAKRSVEKGIKNVVFDRSGYLYFGKIQALADSARENGLVF